MSWLFSRALAAEYWRAESSGGDACVPSKSTDTPQAFWCADKTTDCSLPFPSGMTCEPLMARLGAAVSMWCQAASRAMTSARQDHEPESTEIDRAFGERWRESLARYDLDSCSWKTPQCSLVEGSEQFSGTWPLSGLMRDGRCYPLPTWARPTNANDCGSWPTPKARDWRSGGTDPSKVRERIEKRRNQGVVDLPDALVLRTWSPGLSGLVDPHFCEWIMGWPIGWTALRPLETDRFREWQRQHGDNSQED